MGRGGLKQPLTEKGWGLSRRSLNQCQLTGAM